MFFLENGYEKNVYEKAKNESAGASRVERKGCCKSIVNYAWSGG